MTEIDDYLRLLFAKLGQVFCPKCGMPLRPKTTNEMLADITEKFMDQKVYLLQELKSFTDGKSLQKFISQNRRQVDQGGGTTRVLIAYGWDEITRNR